MQKKNEQITIKLDLYNDRDFIEYVRFYLVNRGINVSKPFQLKMEMNQEVVVTVTGEPTAKKQAELLRKPGWFRRLFIGKTREISLH